ncbi:CD177 antigen [Erinaceus europaeus]|uniref:CD177 antigen n=1 Tax=Erinaceus europaeus TaxID=9365 RepID=A0ABM3WZK7_ERIEU|nr:CD177 antigen [Erinaceus europaeus]
MRKQSFQTTVKEDKRKRRSKSPIMSSALLLALLVGSLLLSRAATLTCQKGIYQAVLNVSQEFFSWTTGTEVCRDSSYGCQDTLLLLENGPFASVVLSKGCVQAPDQEPQLTHHRAGPGLSLISFTRVCREDLCNHLSSTLPIWAPPSSPVPGNVRCHVCLSEEDCLSAPKLTCPVGTTHCYDGVLQIEGGSVFTIMRVQGCMPQAGCNLLNGTVTVGPLALRESCDPKGPFYL